MVDLGPFPHDLPLLHYKYLVTLADRDRRFVARVYKEIKQIVNQV